MSDDTTARADKALEDALAEAGARDPREFYRERLRELKESNPEGYQVAVRYYRETLLPSIVDGAPPLDAWTEYGRTLAETATPGRTVSIDSTGLSIPYEGPDLDRLHLHIPEGKGRALLVGLPRELTPAQRATYDVLVAGKQRLRS
jgi:hypothetical protein